ncbi:hypothetical protein WICPIJ_000358 [Wickerhamomyces pijperi]|uniref:Flavin reductase like domain-containing protein n=1 Tax=Wickerhamomyces pijperi TaxID=599730 RepID=A0A9P8QCT2_WICPI|nr:hypothetical protein WICPIJ_000358 [Wickerhamomyces pijperi]
MSLIFKRFNTTLHFREAMSSIANQVMIITPTIQLSSPSVTPEYLQENILKLKGVTLSSVTSLSIKPSPLLQFNLMIPSITSENLHKFDQFAVHTLIPTKLSTELIQKFSKHREYNSGTNDFDIVSPFRDLKLDQDFELKSLGKGLYLPILKNVNKVMICEKYKYLHVQDHEIWVGKVTEIQGWDNGVKNGGVLNFNRGFYGIGEKI